MTTGESPKARLARHQLRAKKHFGQNFMVDENIARMVAEHATMPGGGTVLEIGAGLGALTSKLLERAGLVIAIERDRDLIPILSQDFSLPVSEGRLRLLESDAKQADVEGLLAGSPHPRVLAGNLPYQLTGPLLSKAVWSSAALDRAVFVIQLEVAERLTARPETGDYGALTVFVNAAFDVKRHAIVRSGAFYPQPRVDSALVVMSRRDVPIALETDAFRTVVKAAFAKRRKTLRNAWHGVSVAGTDVSDAAVRAGIDLNRRGETLSVEEFGRVAQELGV